MRQNSSLAYDYTLFQDSETKPTIAQLGKGKITAKTVSVVKAGGYVLAVIALLSILIYGRATQAELNYKYTQTTKAIAKIKDENKRDQIELETQMSMQIIEEIAKTQLGLDKMDPQQIEYVNFNDSCKAELIKKPSIWFNIAGWFSGIFS